jgi:hypothetical protein
LLVEAPDPALEPAPYDVLLTRRVLWAMPEPVAAFARWVRLLEPDGIVVLVDGRRTSRWTVHLADGAAMR